MPRNPKGIEPAEVVSDRCIGCQACVAECPVGAIQIASDGVARINPDLCVGCGKCADVCPVGAVRYERKRKQKAAVEHAQPEGERGYRGVAVFIEPVNGEGAPVSWELVNKAKELAAGRKSSVMGFVLGDEVEGIARAAIAYGCDEVHMIDHPQLRQYLPSTYGRALAELSERTRPEIFLLGATPLGRELSGVVATRLQTGLTADCTALGIDEEKGYLLMTRPTFGGNIMATIYSQNHRPQMSTVRPRVMKLGAKEEGRQGKIVRHEWEPSSEPLPKTIETQKELGLGLDIGQAPALVVAGKGACDADSMPLLQQLADLVGGMVACSRPVVEAGFLPYERQVGQTGKTVAPKLYIGVGVSGAVQHLVGIQGSEKIVAINSDPEAPIFRAADVGLVGDYRKIVPVLLSALKKRKDLFSQRPQSTQRF